MWTPHAVRPLRARAAVFALVLVALAAAAMMTRLLGVWDSSAQAQPSPCTPGVDCENGMSVGTAGPAAIGATVDVDVSIDYVTTAYLGFDTTIEFDDSGLAFVSGSEVYTGLGGTVLHAPPFVGDDFGGAGLDWLKVASARISGTSSDTGVAVSVDFTCLSTGTHTLRLVPPPAVHRSTTVGPTFAVIPTELVAGSITCEEEATPTGTPTPTLPPAVGGVAELPPLSETLGAEAGAASDGSDSSAPLYGAIVGGAALLVVALGGAGWYARRRWLR